MSNRKVSKPSIHWPLIYHAMNHGDRGGTRQIGVDRFRARGRANLVCEIRNVSRLLLSYARVVRRRSRRARPFRARLLLQKYPANTAGVTPRATQNARAVTLNGESSRCGVSRFRRAPYIPRVHTESITKSIN